MKKNFCFVLFCFLVLSFFSCRRKASVHSELLMDTVCTVNLFDDGTDEIYSRIFRRLQEIENEFSVTKKDSVVSKINSAAGKNPVPVPPDVVRVTDFALRAASLTDGSFNIALGPLVDLWGINTGRAHVPDGAELDGVKDLIDWRDVVLDGENGTVFLKKSGMKLNYGGIVKGFAADEIVKILKECDVKKAVIDLGGNIYVYGSKDNGEPWKVGLKNPMNPASEPIEVLSMGEGSVVTSGVYERFFEQGGRRYHHILDPKTLFPAENNLLSSTVVSSSSMVCDLLSTATFVMGITASYALKPVIEDEFGCEVWFYFVDESCNVISPEFPLLPE